MSRTNHGGPKLPSTLLDQVGSSDGHGGTNARGRKSSQHLGRKEQRKSLRQEKKQQRRTQSVPVRPRFVSNDMAFKGASGNDSDNDQTKPPKKLKLVKDAHVSVGALEQASHKTRSQHVQSISPEPIKAPVSRAVKAKLEEDDAEIAALERKLGLKKNKKRPKIFDDEGFGDLLDGLDDYVDDQTGKRKRSDYDDFLSSKRRHVQGHDSAFDDDFGSSEDDIDEVADESDSSEEDLSSADEAESESEEDFSHDNVEFEGFGDDLDSESKEDANDDPDDTSPAIPYAAQPKQRENPYVAPVPTDAASTGKYIPPSMRGIANLESEDLVRLKRQLQGPLNKLSEANLMSILREIEAIYASHARQHVTQILVNLLVNLLCDRASLLDTFIILHAGFAAAIYKVIGAHFGAQLLERVVSDFERFYDAEKSAPSGSKETTNLIALLSELYTFQLIGNNVIFDYIRLFLNDLTELNTELLLKIIKNCGTQLRHDDPSSLKDVVILLQKSVAKVGESSLPIRTRFMIETINNLKNNRQKTGVAASNLSAEHTARMKKTLGTLNARAKASEPLGVTLSDIKSSSKEGKWWLVGASWKNDVQKSEADNTAARNSEEDAFTEDNVAEQGDSTDLLQLAKEQRMNTDIRRAIFMNIMSASDYKDAHMRLVKLKLKKAQELEIPRVLIHCAGSEQGYNLFYTLIAKRLCTEHRFKWAIQYGLWDLFKQMGEKADANDDSDIEMEDEGENSMDLRKIVNLGRMYGQLIADDALSLTSLKVLNFAYLQPKTKTFVEILLATAFKQLAKSKDRSTDHADLQTAISKMIMRAKDTPQVVTGLQFFISKQVTAEELASSSSERKMLKEACKTAKLILTQLSTSLS